MRITMRMVSAAALGSATLLALGACSTTSDIPTPGPTTSIEQTMSPSPTAGATFNVRTAEESDWAVYADGYVSSDEPQGAGEQYIADTYPDLWAQGIRVLSNKMVPGYNYADPAAPGAVVQYIDGVRYEGTISTPLGFRGQIADPESLPSDAVANTIASLTSGGTWPAGNSGQGGYMIDINEKDPKGAALRVYQFINNSTTKELGSTVTLATSPGYSSRSIPGTE